jgi:signal transduction histidine kinase
MAHGTSAHGEGLSGDWTDAGQEQANSLWRGWANGLEWLFDWSRVTADPAPLQLLVVSVIAGLLLGLTITAAWQPAVDGASGGLSALHLAVLLVACALAALVALRPGSPGAAHASRRELKADEEPSQLLAQMHHELRTPLNAMIGFSEVMLHELHGPLGNARYQEYAAHISESGGRLLRASEDALAVAATMSALLADMVADRRTLRRDRLPAAALCKEAWAGMAAPPQNIRFAPGGCGAVEIECDRQATFQALQHLLGEAIAHAPPGSMVTARSWSAMGGRHIEIATVAPTAGCVRESSRNSAAGDGLRVMLARSLLEMQDATLRLGGGSLADAWSAHIAFPVRAGSHIRRGSGTPSAAARRLSFPARPADFAAAAAARASAGSHAAPQG